uniref:Transposase n=1 Tax=Strongyloides venezuelensis TaxID=75913 RepID=A0A0K0FED8_STRVS
MNFPVLTENCGESLKKKSRPCGPVVTSEARLLLVNMLAISYKHFSDCIHEQKLKRKNKAMPIYKLVLKPTANKNKKVRNLPMVTEIAAIF